jgi:hypothetical protein
MKLADLLVSLHYWAYRVSNFMLMNVLDDPAWLALMFC